MAIIRPFFNGFATNLTLAGIKAKLISCKIQDGGGRNVENHTFPHKSAISAYIWTEFDT